jgi:hypothetical protein
MEASFPGKPYIQRLNLSFFKDKLEFLSDGYKTKEMKTNFTRYWEFSRYVWILIIVRKYYRAK